MDFLEEMSADGGVAVFQKKTPALRQRHADVKQDGSQGVEERPKGRKRAHMDSLHAAGGSMSIGS